MTTVMRKQKKVDAYNFPYAFNPYMGCSYGCNYCFSTNSVLWTSRFKKWGSKPNIVKPKQNVVQDLQKDLDSLKGIPLKEKEVQIGNSFDPYPIMENKTKITRQCLEVFTQYPDWIVHLTTKSKLIIRDIDVFKQIPKFQAEIIITTLTHDKHFEPYAPTTQQRLNTIKKLSDNGIFVRVWIMPILSGYTDINAIKNRAIKCGAKDFKEKKLEYFKISELI